MLTSPGGERATVSFRYDRIRGGLAGIIEAGWLSFTMIVIIRHFHAPAMLKALLNSAGSIGLLLTPLSIQMAVRSRTAPVRICAAMWACVAILLGALAFAGNLWLFSIIFISGALILAQQSPLNIQIYAQNYHPWERGKRLSKVAVGASLMGGVFGYAGGRLLDLDLARFYPGLYLFMALAAGGVAWAYLHIPSNPLPESAAMHPLQHLALARTDRLFGQMLAGWMMLGFANLMCLPIRMEFMVNPAYGINASNETAASTLVMVPLVVRLLTTRWWGRVFDRGGPGRMRTMLNGLFLAGIGVFFATRDVRWMVVGAAIHGFAQSGGDIIWQLWVTKIAPPDRVSHYMSLHTLNTGIRGVVAPFAGYWILRHTHNPQLVGLASVLGMAAAILFFFRVKDDGRLSGRLRPEDMVAPSVRATDGDPAT